MSIYGTWPNITLKRDAPFRGGFESLLFFQLRWLRQSSVKGAPLSFTLGVMSWKHWVTLALVGAMIFLPPRFRIWIASACLSVAAGIFWGFLLICIPLRKIFEVDEDPAVAASLLFALIFVVLFTGKMKAELQKVSSK